jgi:hypothetical protein
LDVLNIDLEFLEQGAYGRCRLGIWSPFALTTFLPFYNVFR